MAKAYDAKLTAEQIEATLETLKHVRDGVRPNSSNAAAIDRTRSVLADIHLSITRRAGLRRAAEKIAD